MHDYTSLQFYVYNFQEISMHPDSYMGFVEQYYSYKNIVPMRLNFDAYLRQVLNDHDQIQKKSNLVQLLGDVVEEKDLLENYYFFDAYHLNFQVRAIQLKK